MEFTWLFILFALILIIAIFIPVISRYLAQQKLKEIIEEFKLVENARYDVIAENGKRHSDLTFSRIAYGKNSKNGNINLYFKKTSKYRGITSTKEIMLKYGVIRYVIPISPTPNTSISSPIKPNAISPTDSSVQLFDTLIEPTPKSFDKDYKYILSHNSDTEELLRIIQRYENISSEQGKYSWLVGHAYLKLNRKCYHKGAISNLEKYLTLKPFTENYKDTHISVDPENHGFVKSPQTPEEIKHAELTHYQMVYYVLARTCEQDNEIEKAKKYAHLGMEILPKEKFLFYYELFEIYRKANELPKFLELCELLTNSEKEMFNNMIARAKQLIEKKYVYRPKKATPKFNINVDLYKNPIPLPKENIMQKLDISYKEKPYPFPESCFPNAKGVLLKTDTKFTSYETDTIVNKFVAVEPTKKFSIT